MGKILQIRVMASTYDPEDMDKAWPRLVALCRPDYPYPKGPKTRPTGVLELVQTLDDRCRFGDWEERAKDALRPGIDAALAVKARLEQALGDWRPTEANHLSDELEEALAALETQAKNVVDDNALL